MNDVAEAYTPHLERRLGPGWLTVAARLMDSATVTLKLRTTGGQKLRITLTRGTGPLGRPGGGEAQPSGVLVLGEWFRRAAAGR